MKTIKLYDGYRVYFDGEVQDFKEHNWDDVMDFINMFKDKEMRMELFRQIFCFGILDLSEAYNGHKLIISLIPHKD